MERVVTEGVRDKRWWKVREEERKVKGGGGGKDGEVEPQGTSELRALPHWQGESPSLAKCTQGH